MARSNRYLLGVFLVLGAACAKGSETTTDDDGGTGASGATGGTGGSPGPMTGSGAMGASMGNGGDGGVAAPGCGDGNVDSGEGCDDGNQSNDDSCPDDPANGGTCQPATCGDGFVWSTDGGTETCDDGNANNNDDCPDGTGGTCLVASCTDGFLHDMGTGDEEAIDCGGSCPPCDLGLILSEVVLTSTASEMIEIHNPTWHDIPLDDVYLADYATYYQITTGGSAPGGFDFRVRFPAGTTIAAGGHVVVSTQSATDFQGVYGFAPDFDFDAADAGAPVMLGEMDGNAGLSNNDEMLVLFHWDGVSDLVADLDYVVWGDTTEAMDKSGVMVGAGTYLAETAVGSQTVAVAHSPGQSIAHCIYTEGTETKTGGNGTSGHDETSEDHANTWDVVDPTPGTFNNCPVVVAPSKDGGSLYHLDRASFAEVDSVLITTPVVADGITSLARHPTTGVTYALLNDIFVSRYLAYLNTATGETESIAQLTVMVSSIAFDASGTLYGIAGDGDVFAVDELGTIDLTTGVFSTVHTYLHFDDGEALALNPLTGLLHRFSGNSAPEMLRVDLAGPTTTPVAWIGTEPGEPAGAFWDPDLAELVLFDTSSNVYTVNPDGTIVDTTFNLPDKLGGALIQ